MAKQLFLNNFDTQFISPVKSAPTSGNPATELDYGILRVATGAAGALVNPSGGDWYILTGFKRSGSVETNVEIMKVTAVDTSVINEVRLTVLRGQEGTTPQSYVSGDYLSMRETAGALAAMVQTSDSRLSDSRTPSGAAGGVLSGTYPNPGFAVDMATQAELDAVAAEKEPTIAAATGTPTAQYWRGDKSWRDLATDVRAAVLTGLSTATNAAVAATDSVLVAIGKLQAQLANYLPKSNGSATGLTVDGLNGGQLAGFRNRIINGGFSVWQRGTSQTLTAAYVYGGPDRWSATHQPTAAGTLTRIAGISTGMQYASKLQRTAGATAVGSIQIEQVMETVDSLSLAGKTVTISAVMKAGANFSGASSQAFIQFITGTGTDQSFAAFTGQVVNSIAVTVSTTAGIVAATFTVPSNCTQIAYALGYTPTGTAGADDSLSIGNVQLEIGSVVTPFEVRPYGTELALCQRYYFKTFSQGVTPAQNTGDFTGALAAFGSPSLIPTTYLSFPVEMRASPTVALYTARSSGATGQWSELSTGALANARAFYTGTRGCTIDNSGTFPPNGIVYSIHATASAEL